MKSTKMNDVLTLEGNINFLKNRKLLVHKVQQ